MINDNIRFDGKEMYRLAYAICQEFLHVLPRASVPGFAIKRTFALIYHLQFHIPGYANETRGLRGETNETHEKKFPSASWVVFFLYFSFFFFLFFFFTIPLHPHRKWYRLLSLVRLFQSTDRQTKSNIQLTFQLFKKATTR